MRYGGHQTFTIRDGWLCKGLEALITDEELLVADNSMDHLGVGRNMAQSINHWLLATGLAEKRTEKNNRGQEIERKELKPTAMAELIWKMDPYFLEEGTWWFIHINMINNPEYCAAWNWFFNSFGQDRFQKRVCLDSLQQHESMNSGRNPSITTLDRDLSCFLASYAQDFPPRHCDPEDEIISPLTELGLMHYHRASGFYNVIRKKRDIPFSVFMYALSKSEYGGEIAQGDRIQIPFYDLLAWHNGPSRVFRMGSDDLFDLLLEYDQSESEFSFYGTAGSYMFECGHHQPIEAMENLYSAHSGAVHAK